MEENKDYVSNPSHMPSSGQEDSKSVFLHSSKMRNKLQKLAQWRIDASLIEFPPDAPEFRGGFATVTQGLLASLSRIGGASKSKHVTDNHPGSETGTSHSDSHAQGTRGEDLRKDEETNVSTAVSDNETKEERKKDDEDERRLQTHDQTSITKFEDQPTSSEHTVDEGSDLVYRPPQLHGDTQGHDGDEEDRDGGTQSGLADGNDDHTKDEGRKRPESTNVDQNSGHQNPKPKIVAVKKLKIEEDTDLERVIGLALRESEFLVELSHPNIVKLEGFVEDLSERKVWLIFPWEEHGNLRDFLASGEWEIPERISLINDVTLGLEYLHGQEPPVYHGDLKSLNILVNSEYHALITDFGSARHLENDPSGKRPRGTEDSNEPRPATDPSTVKECITLEALFSATASTLTLSGSSYTLRWAAPELLQDDGPCLRSDIWSLGWIAYEVMTNTIPFHDVKKDAIVINRVIQGHLPSVTEDARMSLIKALCSLMVQCWNMNPDKRPTAEECRKSISWLPWIVPAPTQGISEGVSSIRYARLLNQLGRMYKRQGDYPNALNCFTKASDIYKINHDNTGKGRNLLSLAELHLFRAEHTEAASFYTDALQIFTESGDQFGRALVIFGLAEVRRVQGEYEEAKRLYAECLQIDTGNYVKRSRATSLFGLASVHLSQGENSEAEKLYSEALEIFTHIGDKASTSSTLRSLGELHRFRGDYSEATKRYSEALEIRTEIGDRPGIGTVLMGLADVHFNRAEYDDAIKLSSEAKEIFTDIGDKYWRARALVSLAETRKMQAHYSEATTLYTEASQVLEEIEDSEGAARVLENAADIHQSLDQASADVPETAKVDEDPPLSLG